MRTTRIRAAQCLLTAAAAVTAFAVLASAASAAPENTRGSLAQALKKTLLVFPIDVPSTAAPNATEVSDLITDVVTSRLVLAGTYSVTGFHKGIPTVARMRNEQRLLDVDVMPPFAEDNQKSVKIAKLIGYDAVFVGSVDEYTFDAAQKQAAVTLSGRIIETETGKVTKNVSLSATSGTGGNAKEEERALDAGRAAGEKLMGQIAPGAAAAATTGADVVKKPAKKSNNGGWLAAIILIGLGIGLGMSGGGGGGGGVDNPPPPP